MKRFRALILYFLIVILGLGTAGLWGPFVPSWLLRSEIAGINIQFFAGNLLTYSASLCFAFLLDHFFKNVKNNVSNYDNIVHNSLIYISIGIIFFIMVVVSVGTIIRGAYGISITLSIILAIISYATWWLLNWNDEKFGKPYTTMGGELRDEQSANS